jgi:hypothetical protein
MPNFTSLRPDTSEYPAAVAHYVELVAQHDVLAELATQAPELERLVRPLTDTQALGRHPPYTWTIKQVVGHMADCERVFGYRALRLARLDPTPLPGFDENAYMQAVDFDRRPLADLLAEFKHLRQSQVLLLGDLSAKAWSFRGQINGHPMTTRAVAYVMAGHARHHLKILAERLSA